MLCVVAENMYDTAHDQSQEFYRTVDNDLYGDAEAPGPTDEYSKRGPADSPECGIYDQPEYYDESGANPYETPQSLFAKK